jgi:hypothetical protein
MNYGQKVLFDFSCISIEGNRCYDLTKDELMILHDFIVEQTHEDLYNGEIEDCPDHNIMVDLSCSYDVFCQFYDEHESWYNETFLQTK